MKFVDDVRVDAAGAARGSLFVDPAADYLKDHFPGAPMLPGLLMLEAAVRAAAVLCRGASKPYVLTRVDRLQVIRRVVPGETLSVQATLTDAPREDAASFAAEARVDGDLAMRARFQMKTL